MPKIFTTHKSNIVRVRWYQWEFLRRNDKYQEEFAAFAACFGTWLRKKGLWFDKDVTYVGKDRTFFIKQIVPQCKHICEKWQIVNPLSPEWTFDRHYGAHEFRTGKYIFLPTGVTAEFASARWDAAGKSYSELIEQLRMGKTIRPAVREGSRLLLEFDLERPTEDLLADAKKIICSSKSWLHYESKARPRVRRRFNDYDDHLQIWDQRHPLTLVCDPKSKLHLSLHPRLQKLTAQGVRDHLDATRRLIEGGYKDLR
jgi:hypothetical protein